MATTVTPSTLKDRAPVFAEVNASAVQSAIDEATRWVSESQWGPSHYNDGVFYLACHILEESAQLNAEGVTPGTSGDRVAPGPVQSEKILTWSASYSVSEGGVFDDAFATTAWGRQFLARRQLIHAATLRTI